MKTKEKLESIHERLYKITRRYELREVGLEVKYIQELLRTIKRKIRTGKLKLNKKRIIYSWGGGYVGDGQYGDDVHLFLTKEGEPMIVSYDYFTRKGDQPEKYKPHSSTLNRGIINGLEEILGIQEE